jgi:hypothetical protein
MKPVSSFNLYAMVSKKMETAEIFFASVCNNRKRGNFGMRYAPTARRSKRAHAFGPECAGSRKKKQDLCGNDGEMEQT